MSPGVGKGPSPLLIICYHCVDVRTIGRDVSWCWKGPLPSSYYLLSLCGCKNYRTWCLLVLERAPPRFSLLGTIFSRICSSPRQISRIHLTQRLYRPAIGLFLKKMTWICAVATQPLIKKKVDVTTCLQLYKRFLSNEEYLFYKYRNIKYSC